MLPDLSFLIALLLGISVLDGTPADPARSLLGSLSCMLVGGALVRISANRGLRALEEEDLLGAGISSRWCALWPLAAWVAAIWGFEWGSWVNTAVPRLWWLTRYVVLLAPALVVFGVSWAARAEIEAGILARRGGIAPAVSARAAIQRGLRRNSMILVPLLVVIGLTEGVWVAGQLGVEPLRLAALWLESMPLLDLGLMIALVLLALPWIPAIFAKALHAEPLAPGRQRALLEEAARAIGLRYKDILVWRTGGRVLNAMVVGFTPGTRTIFMTDGLLEAMSADETLAVFFHEAGHAKKQHLWLFFLAFFGLSLLFYAVRVPLAQAGVPEELQIALQLGIIWFGLLGWMSRRFEREADIYGAEHAAILDPDAPDLPLPGLPVSLPRGPALMVRALDRIRQIMGYTGSHRHGSVEDRMAYVTQYAIDPDVRLGFKQAMHRLKLAILALLVLGVGLAAWSAPGEVARAGARVESSEGMRAYEQALKRKHSDRAAEVERAPEAWRLAYDHFARAVERLEGRDDIESRALRMQASWNAGDTALHGLRDPKLAKTWFEKVLAGLDEWKPGGARAALYRFHCHIDLGRIAAWEYAALPPGDPGRVQDAMTAHLDEAQRLRRLPIAQDPVLVEERGPYLDERLRLLSATIEAARGETAIARQALTPLAALRGGPKGLEKEFVELAEDAKRELARLPPQDPKDG